VSGSARISHFLLLPNVADVNENMRNNLTSVGEWPEGGELSTHGKYKTK
jgi:hypothetical protein